MGQITVRRLETAERRWVAERIDAELRRRAGDGSANALDLHRALVTMTVILSEMMVQADGAPGSLYVPDTEAATGLHSILVNNAALRAQKTEADRVSVKMRMLAHELAHFLMRDWVAPNLYDADAVICTDQENSKVRHEIARDVDRRWM